MKNTNYVNSMVIFADKAPREFEQFRVQHQGRVGRSFDPLASVCSRPSNPVDVAHQLIDQAGAPGLEPPKRVSCSKSAVTFHWWDY